MATGLRFYDGFESVVASGSGSASFVDKNYLFASDMPDYGSNVEVSATYKRSGSYGCRLGRPGYGYGIANWGYPSTDRAIIGCAFNLRGISSGAPLLSLVEGYDTAVHLYAAVMSDYTVAIYRGDGTKLAQSTLLVPYQNWFYMEFYGLSHNSAGAAEIRVNRTTYCSVTGADTYNGGTSPPVINGFRICRPFGGSNAVEQWIDDVYFLDKSVGGADFLGDVRVLRLAPTNSGNYTNFTPSTGSNWDCVNEVYSATTETDYVQSGTVGHKDTYSLADTGLSTGTTVHALQVIAEVQRTDAGARTIRTLLREGATDAGGTTVTPAYGGPQLLRHIYDTKPSGGAWTVTTANDTEAGLEVVS